MRNAIPQDAGLGRGTESPYLDILNHIGLEYDENAPMGVSDEVMCAIGPSSKIRRLEGEWLTLEAALEVRYGKATKATGEDKKLRDRKSNELRAAKQQQRRNVEVLIRKDHFKTRNTEELDRQLLGLHGPQQPLQKVIFSLPERRVLADILGDLDEDLPEDEIVRRKVDAINAWIKYAWKIEPKEPVPTQSQIRVRTPLAVVATQREVPQAVLELPGRTLAPKPWYTSMIQEPVSPAPPMPLGTPLRQDPPPPYSEVDSARAPNAVIPNRNGVGSPSAVQQPMTRRHHECIFCTRCFTRKAKMWDCADRHLMRRPTDAVSCPHPDCKPKGIELENELQFKNHAKVVHHYSLRPKVTLRKTVASPPESSRSTPKIRRNASAHPGQKHGTLDSPRRGSTAERTVSKGRNPSRMASTAEEVQEGEYYQVEAILESRQRQGRRQGRRQRGRKEEVTLEYLVKWEGYGNDHNTWEPAAHFKRCPEILQRFHQLVWSKDPSV